MLYYWMQIFLSKCLICLLCKWHPEVRIFKLEILECDIFFITDNYDEQKNYS